MVGARRQIGCIVNLGSACRGADEMFIFNFSHFPAVSAAGLECETTTLTSDSFKETTSLSTELKNTSTEYYSSIVTQNKAKKKCKS